MKVKKMQQGGEMGGQPAQGQTSEVQPTSQGGAPEQEGGGAEEQIMAIAQDIIQQMGPEAAGMLAQVILEMLQGGGQPQPQPTFQRKGGSLVRKK